MPARNPAQEKEILQWIEAVLGEKLPAGDYEEVGIKYEFLGSIRLVGVGSGLVLGEGFYLAG